MAPRRRPTHLHHGVLMAPHHDPQIHGHLVAAAENGAILEVFPNPVRDPVWDGLFAVQPEIVNGEVLLSDRPGLGLELDRDFVERHRGGNRRMITGFHHFEITTADADRQAAFYGEHFGMELVSDREIAAGRVHGEGDGRAGRPRPDRPPAGLGSQLRAARVP